MIEVKTIEDIEKIIKELDFLSRENKVIEVKTKKGEIYRIWTHKRLYIYVVQRVKPVLSEPFVLSSPNKFYALFL